MGDIEKLAMRYASNRLEHKEIQQTIDEASRKSYAGIESLAIAYQEWSQRRSEAGIFGAGWPGWVHVLAEHQEYADVDPEFDFIAALEVAKLRDRQRELREELGHIRRAVAAKGRALLREKWRHDNEQSKGLC